MNYYIRQNSNKPVIIIAIINVVIFLFGQIIAIKIDIPPQYYTAKINSLIATGDWWRIISSMFTHWGFTHILLNLLSLYIFSKILLPFFGAARHTVIYMVSGVGGVAISYAFSPSISGGASGAIFGLLGANLYLYYINPQAYKQYLGRDLLIITAINIIFTFTTSSIDIGAHLGGLVFGFLCAYSTGVKYDQLFTPKRIIASTLTVVLIGSALFVPTTLSRKDPVTYYDAINYQYQLFGPRAALHRTEKARKKYPEDQLLQSIYEQLKREHP